MLSKLRTLAPSTSRTLAARAAASSALQARAMSSSKNMSFSPGVNYLKEWTDHQQLQEWVLDRIRLLEPSRVELCDGSEDEYEKLIGDMVSSGTLIKLNEELRPNSYLARSDVGDVARVEENTFICSEREADAGGFGAGRGREERDGGGREGGREGGRREGAKR